MDNVIEQLAYDSETFGMRIGKMMVSAPILELQDNQPFDLIYLISDFKELNINGSTVGCTSEKRQYSMNIDIAEHIHEPHIHESDAPSNQIKELVFQSGQHSRFFVDPILRPGFYKMYEDWLLKSYGGSMAKYVFVYQINEEALGLITLKPNNDALSIGLLAVDEKSRGMGIGRKLIQHAMKICKQEGLTRLTVDTQGENEAACLFYHKTGFEISHKSYIYHLWKS